MFSRRVQYFMLLFSVLTYYAASGEWLSWVLLLTVAGLPWLSLLLSLPAIWNFQASPAGAEVLEQGKTYTVTVQGYDNHGSPIQGAQETMTILAK